MKRRVFLNKPIRISYESEKSTLDMFDWILEYARGNEYNNQDEKTLEYANQIRKELEAFRIIKEKIVDVLYLIHKFEICDYSYLTYLCELDNYFDAPISIGKLTEEEFNLLKEVLA